MEARVTPAAVRLRRQTVEHPFATIKYRIFEQNSQELLKHANSRITLDVYTQAVNSHKRG